MIGITVGVGSPYFELGVLAAECFSACTGLPARVLGDAEFEQSRLPHPAALRLDCLEYTDAASIVYFDADWFNLARWQPRAFDDGYLYAARDFTTLNEWPRQQYDFESSRFKDIVDTAESACLDGEPRQDYIEEVTAFMKCRTSPASWINTGLMVLHRGAHDALLRRARSLYLGGVGHHPKYFEQPAINAALGTEHHILRLLPRAYNVLATRPALWPRRVVGLHVKVNRHPDFVRRVLAGNIRSIGDVREYFLQP